MHFAYLLRGFSNEAKGPFVERLAEEVSLLEDTTKRVTYRAPALFMKMQQSFNLVDLASPPDWVSPLTYNMEFWI